MPPTLPFRARAATLVAVGLLSAACLLAPAARAQVVVVLQRPAVGRLGVADLYRLQAISPAGPARVRFRGTLTERRAGLLYEVETDAVDLRQGPNTLRVSDLEPIRVITEPRDTRLREALVRTGEPPAGDYEVCVSALDATSGAELGRDCYTQPIDPLSPPLLVSPSDGEQLATMLATFVWTPPVPVPRGRLTYGIRIAEMLSGQVPELAARSNPAVFETDRLTAPTLVYPSSARPLRAGRYAWTITAYVDGAAVAQSRAAAFAVPAATPRSGQFAGTLPAPVQLPAVPPTVSPAITQPLDARLRLGACTTQCDPLTDPAPTISVAFGGTAPGQPAGSPAGGPAVSPAGAPVGGVVLSPGLGAIRVSPAIIQGALARPGASTTVGAPAVPTGPVTAPQNLPPVRP